MDVMLLPFLVKKALSSLVDKNSFFKFSTWLFDAALSAADGEALKTT
jgi:hypothetical protein